ncbi:Serine/threonine/tyrosine-interacting protein-like protein [Emericellopsis cladophorae]|uniref:Serine/threonine/tyrosine-interacting protein-like protein n=1 Tax=Emericellopsis cladophorae TaxID=2686198 RepID=A0A9P9Y732_9HYPO|nr:Serine/threonine/tyrosine-interacting protein-like protein [Emericellopsis cladophorae]KAI6784798.1 Serine/threonine/tyrosine-interacting protein-like protein [Emericellopsis cladophorae]
MKKNFAPSAPYSRRAPSPPALEVRYPLMRRRAGSESQFVLVPSYENADAGQLTAEDLSIITGNETRLIAENKSADWRYEDRRKAQRVLDFLYVGPVTAIRDLQFLQNEGITMIIIVRNTRLPSRSLEMASQQLGIVGEYVEVMGTQQLIHNLPKTISTINQHLLHVYRSQAHQCTLDGEMVVDPATFKRGKVLVTCESGNELSPAIVAAYIMAVYGNSFESAVQFIVVQRFCVSIDASLKQMLCTWGGILNARAVVSRDRGPVGSEVGARPIKTAKRAIHDTISPEDHTPDQDKSHMQDQERFCGREAFAPFHDVAPES